MRIVFLILLLSNLLLFAWGQGLVYDRETGKEPERIERQIGPESLRIVSASGLPVCRRIEWLSASDAERLSTSLATVPDWAVEQFPQVEAPAHWVLLPNLPSRAFAERKMGELRRMGVNEGEIVEDASNGPFVVSLGIFRGQETATAYFESLTQRGVRSVRMLPRTLPPERFALELRAFEEELTEKLPSLKAGLGEVLIVECPPR